ncbi:MAG: hypothetical protein H6998_08655 [Hahellaceae bacterium]|jgi:hypothetical protein|nr:hypothetical protein [Hahellaceae bacterium]
MQKLSYITGIICFVLSIASGLFAIIHGMDVGWNDVMTASAMATTFFLISTGFVLVIMGKASLPKLHFDKSEK